MHKANTTVEKKPVCKCSHRVPILSRMGISANRLQKQINGDTIMELPIEMQQFEMKKYS